MRNPTFRMGLEQSKVTTNRAGVDYLHRVSGFLPETGMVDVMDNIRDRDSICQWIGKSIEAVNLQLQIYLRACDECFNDIYRKPVQIFAVPFAASVPLDGFCNISVMPTTILVDVGRVTPDDWLALVAHEYAHAHLGYPGHDAEYAKVLNHLCLGLGLPVRSSSDSNLSLQYWPPYRSITDPLAFWRGDIR